MPEPILSKKLNKTSTNRWKDEASYVLGWQTRTKQLLDLFMTYECDENKNYHFAEFGCGHYAPLHTICSNNEKFKVSKFDIKKWDEETSLLNFNDKNFTIPSVDVCVFSGVLEYLNDLELVIDKTLAHCDYILMSYAFMPLNASENDEIYLNKMVQRTKNGWRNHYTNKEIVKIVFSKAIISGVDIYNTNQILLVIRNRRVDFT